MVLSGLNTNKEIRIIPLDTWETIPSSFPCTCATAQGTNGLTSHPK